MFSVNDVGSSNLRSLSFIIGGPHVQRNPDMLMDSLESVYFLSINSSGLTFYGVSLGMSCVHQKKASTTSILPISSLK